MFCSFSDIGSYLRRFLIEQCKCGCFTMMVKIILISILKTGLCVYEMHMRNCQIPTVPRHIFAYLFEEMTEALEYMNRNELLRHTRVRKMESVFAILSIEN